MVHTVFATTGTVVIVAVPVVVPAAITILAGAVAAALLLPRVTVVPPTGAAASNVTVSVDASPPVTDAEDNPRLATTGGVTVSVVDAATPFKVPEIVDVPEVETAAVVIVTDPVC
jgi:large-conductance mechanosensitive channel